jgi:NAD(P)-dependent dehydrogenase (short-subunit alcohol dehydrogenase family)
MCEGSQRLDAPSDSAAGRTVILTGITGFLGGHFARALMQQNDITVCAVVRGKGAQGYRQRVTDSMLNDVTREAVVAVGDRGHPPTLKPPNIQCQPINVTMPLLIRGILVFTLRLFNVSTPGEVRAASIDLTLPRFPLLANKS